MWTVLHFTLQKGQSGFVLMALHPCTWELIISWS
jgi:hypothetical protein